MKIECNTEDLDLQGIGVDKLIELYSALRGEANAIAVELESRGMTGYYQRPDTREKKRLEPSTRPTQFHWYTN